jgi:hypothetical protein
MINRSFRLVLIALILITVITGSCEKEEDGSISIRTDRKEYSVFDSILIRIRNKTSDSIRLYHAHCGFVQDSWTIVRVNRYTDSTWVEEDVMRACPFMGIPGYYWTTIHAGGSILYSESFNMKGRFQLQFRFLIAEDTVYLKSNEIFITDPRDDE